MVLLITKEFIEILNKEISPDGDRKYYFVLDSILKNFQWSTIYCDFDLNHLLGKTAENEINEIFDQLLNQYSQGTKFIESSGEEMDNIASTIDSEFFLALFDSNFPRLMDKIKKYGRWLLSPYTIDSLLNDKFLQRGQFDLDSSDDKSNFLFSKYSDLNSWKHHSRQLYIIDRYIKNGRNLENNLKPLIRNLLIFNNQELLKLTIATDFRKLQVNLDTLITNIQRWKIPGLKKIDVKFLDIGYGKWYTKYHARFVFTDYLRIKLDKGIEIFDSNENNMFDSSDEVDIEHCFTEFNSSFYLKRKRDLQKIEKEQTPRAV